MSTRIVVCERSTQRSRPLVESVPPEHDSESAPWAGIKLEHYKSCPAERPEVTTDFYLAAVCLSGSGHADYAPCKAKEFRAVYEPGSVSLTGPGVIPPYRFTGDIEFVVIEVAPKFIVWAADELVAKRPIEIAQSFAVRAEGIRHILLTMHYELLNGFQSGRLFGECIGLSFATALLTRHSNVPIHNGQYKGGLPQFKLRQVAEYIDVNLSALSLREMADQLDMGPCHFARAFKESVGVSPHQYVLRRRIERALQLLKGSHPSLAEISRELGFSSQGHFSTIFHRFVGVSPSSYREQVVSLKSIHLH
jgi:AraC family transcriptional regulator